MIYAFSSIYDTVLKNEIARPGKVMRIELTLMFESGSNEFLYFILESNEEKSKKSVQRRRLCN